MRPGDLLGSGTISGPVCFFFFEHFLFVFCPPPFLLSLYFQSQNSHEKETHYQIAVRGKLRKYVGDLLERNKTQRTSQW